MRHKLVKVKNIISLSSAFQESKHSAVAVPRMGLLYGFTGIGKTTATAWLVNKENGIYVRATSVWSPSAMLQDISIELSLDPPSLPAKMLIAVKEQMKLSRRPLFIDEADYLFHNPKMLQVARDIHDLTELPVWLIGIDSVEKKIANRKIVAGRISQWVKFQPCDLEDTRLLAKELCEIDIHEDLLVKLHELSNGSIRLITVGLSRVEAFTKAQRWQSISAQQWSERPFFLSRQI
jgi:DNA transposition AAA+ family ATPase